MLKNWCRIKSWCYKKKVFVVDIINVKFYFNETTFLCVGFFMWNHTILSKNVKNNLVTLLLNVNCVKWYLTQEGLSRLPPIFLVLCQQVTALLPGEFFVTPYHMVHMTPLKNKNWAWKTANYVSHQSVHPCLWYEKYEFHHFKALK